MITVGRVYMKVKFRLDVWYAGKFHEEYVEFNEDITDEALGEAVKQWAWEHIGLNWERLDD